MHTREWKMQRRMSLQLFLTKGLKLNSWENLKNWDWRSFFMVITKAEMMVLEISTETNLMEHGDGKINPKAYSTQKLIADSEVIMQVQWQNKITRSSQYSGRWKIFFSHRIHQRDVGAEFWQEKFSQSNLQLVPQKLKGRYNAKVINVWLIRKVHQHEIVNAAQENKLVKPVDSIEFIFPLKFENVSNQTV